MYCVYLDKEVPQKDMNREHIIPLSLGGANGFEILVDSVSNATLGSDVDGVIANDFFISFARREHDSRGHSNKEPFPLAKKSRLSDSGKPVQVAFKKEQIEVFSPIDQRNISESELVDEKIESSFKIDPYSRMRFTAKVALAAGYFIYGDLFKNRVNHDEIRRLITFDRKTSEKKDFEGVQTKGWFWPFPVEEKDKADYELYKFLANRLNCSFVMAIPGPSNIGLIIGLLGEIVGIINCPAKTEEFPIGGEHDLGHVVSLKGGKITRISYRELAKQAATEKGWAVPES